MLDEQEMALTSGIAAFESKQFPMDEVRCRPGPWPGSTRVGLHVSGWGLHRPARSKSRSLF